MNFRCLGSLGPTIFSVWVCECLLCGRKRAYFQRTKKGRNWPLVDILLVKECPDSLYVTNSEPKPHYCTSIVLLQFPAVFQSLLRYREEVSILCPVNNPCNTVLQLYPPLFLHDQLGDCMTRSHPHFFLIFRVSQLFFALAQRRYEHFVHTQFGQFSIVPVVHRGFANSLSRMLQ